MHSKNKGKPRRLYSNVPLAAPASAELILTVPVSFPQTPISNLLNTVIRAILQSKELGYL